MGDLLKGLLGGDKGLLGGDKGLLGGGNIQPAQQQDESAGSDARAGVPPTYTPPIHGSDPHGQGTVAALDLTPSDDNPLPASPSDGEEDLIIGDSAASQTNGTYGGRVTLLHLNLLGLINSPLLEIETAPGETKSGLTGPLNDTINAVLCTPLGQGDGCVEVLPMNSATTTTGSENSFGVLGIDLSLDLSSIPAVGMLLGDIGLQAGVAQSTGDIHEANGCQTATGSSSVANVSVSAGALTTLLLGGPLTVGALESESESVACADGTTSQTNSSSVVGLQGTGIPVPATGCDDGTPNTEFILPLVLSVVCNADDSNSGVVAAPYGVREALTVFLLPALNLLKVTLAGPESHAVAPAGPPDTPTNPPGDDGNDGGGPQGAAGGGGNPGDDGSGEPGGPATTTARAGGGELAFTGSNLLVLGLTGGSLIMAGIALATRSASNRRPAA